jgi:cytochrome c oxidase subunit II
MRRVWPAQAGMAALGLIVAGQAFAAEAGHPVPMQIGFQQSVTPIASYIHWFHDDIILPIIVAICVFVAALLLICVFRFNERANPTPSKTTHHTGLEVAWTILPVLLLVIIAIPSFKLLTEQLVIPKADLTIKVTGKQWYWSYDYPKDQNGGFGFDSVLKQDSDLKEGDIRLLSVDNELVVPVNKVVRVQITGADVIHSWVVQSLGARMDAVPGRLNETWFKAEREGIYYGQCSKLCGKDHAYMPIAVRVVNDTDYSAWLQDAKKKFASRGNPTYADASALTATTR